MPVPTRQERTVRSYGQLSGTRHGRRGPLGGVGERLVPDRVPRNGIPEDRPAAPPPADQPSGRFVKADVGAAREAEQFAPGVGVEQ